MGGTKELWTRPNAIALQETESNKEKENSGSRGVSILSIYLDEIYDECSGYCLYLWPT